MSLCQGFYIMQPEELEQYALTSPERARLLAVVDADSCIRAGEELLLIKAAREEVETIFGPVVRKAYEAHKAAVMARARVEEPLIEAEKRIKFAMGAYELEQRRIAAETERIERARLEREAERARDMELILAKSEGASEIEIDEISRRPLQVPSVALRPPHGRPSGVSVRENWKAVIEDKLKLVRYVGSNPDHLNLVEPNTVALNQLARALKSAMNIPGVRVVTEAIVAAVNSERKR